MMAQIEPLKYRYILDLKLNQVRGRTLVNVVFPHAEDLTVSSKNFENLEDAVRSLNDLNTEIALSLNEAVQEERFGLLSEINPARSNEQTLSKEWAANEVAKIWIIDKIAQEQKSGPIKAVALAQILEVHEEPVLVQ